LRPSIQRTDRAFLSSERRRRRKKKKKKKKKKWRNNVAAHRETYNNGRRQGAIDAQSRLSPDAMMAS
jgi:hypothetical protein